MIQEFPQTFLVLDALDECGNRYAVLEYLEDLLRLKLKLHILVTSRPEQDIKWSLESVAMKESIVCLQNTLVDKDISRYVHETWSKDKALMRWKDDTEIQKEVEEHLMKKADGMQVALLLYWVSLRS
jgi:hypothetical protein